MLGIFPFWMHFQERRGKPALIPNSIWKNTIFSTICIMVLMSWAVLQSMEWFFSLFFQRVQDLPVLAAAIRFIPDVIVGIILNVTTGLMINRVPAYYLVLITSAICALSPMLMAIIDPLWSWWYCAFWAMLLLPLSADVIFTVANLIITESFPDNSQALAGAVFNTMAQLGTSIGISVMAVISSSVNQERNGDESGLLMPGYRAVFWACFALMLVTTVVGIYGLRGIRKIGINRN